jgi:DNA-binding ferritin-like protein
MTVLERLNKYRITEQDFPQNNDEISPEENNQHFHLLRGISNLIIDSARLHYCHFRISSGFIHETLGKLYKCYANWADDLMETSHYPSLLAMANNFSERTVDYDIATTTPLGTAQEIIKFTKNDLTIIYNNAESLRDRGISSIAENILVELERFQYMLTNLS